MESLTAQSSADVDTASGSGEEFDISRVWSGPLMERIAAYLPPNQAACLRLVDKGTAEQLASRNSLCLGQAVQEEIFKYRWAQPGSYRELSRKQRFSLIGLTACTNVVSNLEVAQAATGVEPDPDLITVAASAGALDSCRFLDKRLPVDGWRGVSSEAITEAAAWRGHGAVVTWALERRPAAGRDSAFFWRAAEGAARGGHVALMDEMLTEALAKTRTTTEEERVNYTYSCFYTVVAALSGCDLATVERTVERLCGGVGLVGALRGLDSMEHIKQKTMAAALNSVTPDWAAKAELVWAACPEVDWCGDYPIFPDSLTVKGCRLVSTWKFPPGEELVARLTWLKAHGVVVSRNKDDDRLNEAVAKNEAALRWLLAEGVRPDTDISWRAAKAGHLGVLQLLKQEGYVMDPADLADAAARNGQVGVLEWVVQSYGTYRITCDVLSAACYSGVETMRWVLERLRQQQPPAGPPAAHGLPPCTWCDVARAGCEAAAELLAELGCPMPTDGSPYHDIIQGLHPKRPYWMFPVLHRLGVGFGPVDAGAGDGAGGLMFKCANREVPLSILQWLVTAGCPVNWLKLGNDMCLAATRPYVGRPPYPIYCGLVNQWARDQGDRVREQEARLAQAAVFHPSSLSRIASFLPPNEVACSLRFVDRCTAELCREHAEVRLSEPVPGGAFAARWSAPGACRGLSLDRRFQLVRATACTNVVPNLEVALAATGLGVEPGFLNAAAAAGALASCRFLAERLSADGRHGVSSGAIATAAAEAGHSPVVAWALERCPEAARDYICWAAAEGAARGGHVSLMDQLLAEALADADAEEEEGYDRGVVVAALSGCDLATVERLFRGVDMVGAMRLWEKRGLRAALGAALCSTTADWAAKAEAVLAAWPNGAKCGACQRGARCGEGLVARFEWLRAHGFRAAAGFPSSASLSMAACNGAALRWLLPGGPSPPRVVAAVTKELAVQGRVDALQVVKEAGWPLDPASLARWGSTLKGAQTAVLDLVCQQLGWPDEDTATAANVFATACACGSVDVMRSLAARLQPGTLPEAAWSAVARSGCEAAAELLAELGCPMPADGSPYMAVVNLDSSDLPYWMFPVLHRLGVRFGPPAKGLVSKCIRAAAPLSTLQWLRAEGCPVPLWSGVGSARRYGSPEVIAWVESFKLCVRVGGRGRARGWVRVAGEA